MCWANGGPYDRIIHVFTATFSGVFLLRIRFLPFLSELLARIRIRMVTYSYVKLMFTFNLCPMGFNPIIASLWILL